MTPDLKVQINTPRIVRSQNALSISPARTLLWRAGRISVPHFMPDARIYLKQCTGNLPRPLAPCQWLHDSRFSLALCPNPYPEHPQDLWLLCHSDGTACFSAPTPELARLHFFFITGALAPAKPRNRK